MANSAGRRKNIRQQNTAMRKTLEKLRRKAPAAGVVAGGEAATAGAEMGAGAVPEGANWLSKLSSKGKKFSGSGAGKLVEGIGSFLLLDMLIRNIMGGAQDVQQAGLQGQAAAIQGQAAGPLAQEQAMQPVLEAQKNQALMMLMRQMGQPTPTLAQGEAWT